MMPGPQSYTTDVIPQPAPPAQQSTGSLGANFSGLIGNKVTVPAVPVAGQTVVTETTTKKKRKAKKNENGEISSRYQ